MKAEELRIGNIVYSENKEQIIVENIQYGCVNYLEGINFEIYESLDKITPILLTEEWLDKLGFKKDYDNCQTLIIDKNRFQWSKNILTWQQDPHNDWSSFYCEYIHQLQNLYYALVGRDLAVVAVAPPCP